jgi:eukaryotic-like serine/threonine-protein kinase
MITYVPDLGKDMVLEMRFKGRNLKADDRVLKSSKIDLVLGDGNVGYEEEVKVDSLANPVEVTPTDGE